jgi:LDH2 family malate/lactate/ureidoglycolate dehydrogenase
VLPHVDYPEDADQELVVPAEALRELLTAIYVKKGMFKAMARIVAQRQVEADLRGISSHGARAAPRYAAAMDRGDIDPRGEVRVEIEAPAMALLDGGRNLGHVAATKAVELAVAKARDAGTGTVAVRNSHHLGAASLYALLAAHQGMIGFCTTSTGRATVAAYGSNQAATANNAFAWAAPSREGPPFCLDMACAVSSWGKVDSLRLYGQALPEGWALDEAGQPTTDAGAARVLRPAAGPRGFGLAFLCSLLAGPLAGGRLPLFKSMGAEVHASEHFVYVIDVARFVPPDRFHEELERARDQIRALAPAAGFDAVSLPGDREWRRAAVREQSGIPLHRQPLEELAQLAKKLKLPVPWQQPAP